MRSAAAWITGVASVVLCAVGCGGASSSGGEAGGSAGQVAGSSSGGAGAGASSGGAGMSSGGAGSSSGGAGTSSGGAGSSSGGAGAWSGGADGLVDCDPKKILCRIVSPVCPQGEVPSVKGSCYGDCVKIDRCGCTSAAQCPQPDQYTCLVGPGHCSYYLK